MTRPSRNIDIKLLKAGRELIPMMGISGLKVRDVAKKAGVNPGMFNYHFGTKEQYLEALMIDVYNEFLADFKLEATVGDTALERLRNALISGAHFIRDNRTLIAALFEEILKGNKGIVEFARKNMTKHVKIFLGLIAECQANGYITKTSIFSIAPAIIGAAALPSIAVRVIEKNYQNTFMGAFIPMMRATVLSDKIIAQRIDFALKGVAPEPRNAK